MISIKAIGFFAIILSAGCGAVSLPTDVGSALTPRVSFSPQAGSGFTSSVQSGYAMEVQKTAVMNNASAMFGMIFVGGYYPWQREFNEGEWTEWDITDGESDTVVSMRYAFLKRLPYGRSWWQLRVGDGDIIYETLINDSDFSTERLRARVGDSEPIEIDVSEDAGYPGGASRIAPPSMEDIFVREETLHISAGSFPARYYRYSIPDGGGEIALWVSDDVPGGLVRYRWREGDEETNLSLQDFGTGATTRLNSY